MPDDRETWIRHSFYLALFTSFFHGLQFVAALLLSMRTDSAALMAFGLDALVSAAASALIALRTKMGDRFATALCRAERLVAVGYMIVAAGAFYLGTAMLWRGERPPHNIAGIVLAAVSMLVIPIIGSYMKTLAVELRSRMLKSAAVFTFGNSYLSLVLLIALLLNSGMDLRWGDPVGALVMFPFMAQKGIQILLEEGKHEYVED